MHRFVEAHNRRGELAAALGFRLGGGRGKILFQLREGPATLRELADANGVDAPYTTLIVDKLEAHGLVERRPHPDDRRRKLVTLTAAGHAAIATADTILFARPRRSGNSRPRTSGSSPAFSRAFSRQMPPHPKNRNCPRCRRWIPDQRRVEPPISSRRISARHTTVWYEILRFRQDGPVNRATDDHVLDAVGPRLCAGPR